MKKYTFIALVAISVFSCDMITKDTDEEVDKLKDEIAALLAKIEALENDNKDTSAEIQELKDKYGVKEKQTTILAKHYTEGNPMGATVYYDDENADEGTSVIFIGFLNVNGVWVNVDVFEGVLFAATLYAGGDYGHSGKSGYAAVIEDYEKELLSRQIKILFIL
jgi:outer membrane murein-binding lipoprotein Lpp